MLAEVGLALVEEEHWIDRAVEAGKIPLLMFRVEVVIAVPVRPVAVGGARGRRGLVLHGRHVGLEGLHLRVHVLQHVHYLGERWFGHSGGWVGCG